MKKIILSLVLSFSIAISFAQIGDLEIDDNIISAITKSTLNPPVLLQYTNAKGFLVGDEGALLDNNGSRMDMYARRAFRLGVYAESATDFRPDAMYVTKEGRVGFGRQPSSNTNVHIKQLLGGYTLLLDRDAGNTHIAFAESNSNKARITYDVTSAQLRFYNTINGLAMAIDDQQNVLARRFLHAASSRGTIYPVHSGFSNALGLSVGKAGFILDNGNTDLNIVSRNNLIFGVNENSTYLEAMNISTAGKVGINTVANGSSTFHIMELGTGSGTALMIETPTGATGNPNILFKANSANKANFRYNSASNGFDFQMYGAAGNALATAMHIQDDGKVGINTNKCDNYQLAVEGHIGAREIEVTNATWADFVFKDDYDLRSLSEVDSFIQEHGHLPDVPSEAEALANPHNLGNMDVLLLQKVEELTLYTIEQQKMIEELSKELELLKAKK